jgi:hypothetical protein
MRVHFEAGAEGDIDLLSGPEYREGVNRLIAGRQDRSLRRPAMQSGTMPSSGGLLLDLGGPPSGTLWVPLVITVTGGDDHTTVANSSVALYMGGEATLNPMPLLSNLLIPATTATILPYWQQLGGKDALYLNQGDNLFCIVYGAASGTNITAVARIREVHPSFLEELNTL